MERPAQVSTHEKALRINLDPTRFGSIAEIGAGQEVAAWFFKVGAASGTVAKSVSAYDKAVSDALYGAAERYVSQQRVEQMLEREFGALLEQIPEARKRDSHLFAFADTISARNFKGTNVSHGWLGIRYQQSPLSECSDIILHVNLLNTSAISQQEVLGILGVNLIYSALFTPANLRDLLMGLLDGIEPNRIEIDFIEFKGAPVVNFDLDSLPFLIPELGLSPAVLFDEGGHFVSVTDTLYKRPLVVERLADVRLKQLHLDLLERGVRQLASELPPESRPPLGILDVPQASLGVSAVSPEVESREIRGSGYALLVSRFPQHFLLSRFLGGFHCNPIRMVMGVDALMRVFEEGYYSSLAGGIIESMGELLKNGIGLYVSPIDRKIFQERMNHLGINPTFWSIQEVDSVCINAIRPNSSLGYLFEYLVQERVVQELRG